MTIELKGKRVLFFSPAFFSYEEKIKQKMEELDATVDMYDERSVTKGYHRALLKLSPKIFRKKTEKYYYNILNTQKQINYDYVLFIKCDMPTEEILQNYKLAFPNAKFCLHMWDSISNIPDVENKFKYFDHITSFDRYDSLNYNEVKFRPLFFSDEFDNKNQLGGRIYDLCFIGTIHSDRYKILKSLIESSENQGLKFYYYPFLQSKFIYYFYLLTKKEFRGSKKSDFKYEKMTSLDISEKINNSCYVIDIQHPKQTGLTMRTIEMLGMRKKLITTNHDIMNYTFYNSKNIHLIDRKEPKLSSGDLINEEYIESVTIDKYSIESFVVDILYMKGEFNDFCSNSNV